MPSKDIKDLMKPRFKVIADFPGNRFKVGAIFTKDIDGTYVDENGNVTIESNLSGFPNIFRLMEWWEEREESEMPEYVKYDVSGEIVNFIKHWNGERLIVGEYGWSLKLCKPATEEEYNEYINSKA